MQRVGKHSWTVLFIDVGKFVWAVFNQDQSKNENAK